MLPVSLSKYVSLDSSDRIRERAPMEDHGPVLTSGEHAVESRKRLLSDGSGTDPALWKRPKEETSIISINRGGDYSETGVIPTFHLPDARCDAPDSVEKPLKSRVIENQRQTKVESTPRLRGACRAVTSAPQAAENNIAYSDLPESTSKAIKAAFEDGNEDLVIETLKKAILDFGCAVKQHKIDFIARDVKLVYEKASLFFIACRLGNLEIVKLLSEGGTDFLEDKPVCSNQVTGRTPLMMAVMQGNTDVVSYLLSLGADVAACDSDGNNVDIFNITLNSREPRIRESISSIIADYRRERGIEAPELKNGLYWATGIGNPLLVAYQNGECALADSSRSERLKFQAIIKSNYEMERALALTDDDSSDSLSNDDTGNDSEDDSSIGGALTDDESSGGLSNDDSGNDSEDDSSIGGALADDESSGGLSNDDSGNVSEDDSSVGGALTDDDSSGGLSNDDTGNVSEDDSSIGGALTDDDSSEGSSVVSARSARSAST